MGGRAGRPELVIFDLDGTLIDSEPISLGAWVKAAREFGLEMSRRELLQFLGRSNQAIAELAFELYGWDVPFQEIFHRKGEIASLEYQKGIPLKPGVHEVLSALEDLGIRRCIATSSSRKRSGDLLESIGLAGRFEFVITGEDIVHSKPHPEIFLQCLARTGIPADRAMVVEDSRNGIVAAKQAGATAVLIPDVLEPDEEMKEHADLIFGSLLELKDHLIKS